MIRDFYPSQWAMAHNPVTVDIQTDGTDIYTLRDVTGGATPGTLLYEGSVQGDASIDVAEVIQAAFQSPPPIPYVAVSQQPFIPEAGINTIQPTSIVTVLGSQIRRIHLAVTSPQGTDNLTWNVLPGGTSMHNYRLLRHQGSDFVAQRVRNYAGNFFLTTRSDKWVIPVPETEVMPLVFVHPGAAIVFTEPITGKQYTHTPATSQEGKYALLDIDRMRRWFYETYHVIPSVLDVSVPSVAVSQQPSCRIVITRAALARQRQVIIFLNSYGAWETISLPGTATITPVSPEEQQSKRWDPLTADFYAHRERLPLNFTAAVQTGYADADRMRLLLDMMTSQHVYMLIAGAWQKVIPVIEENAIPIRPIEPQGITLQFTLSRSECHITDIVDIGTSQPPRIHTPQFNPPFN